jgi:hypothetical protein
MQQQIAVSSQQPAAEPRETAGGSSSKSSISCWGIINGTRQDGVRAKPESLCLLVAGRKQESFYKIEIFADADAVALRRRRPPAPAKNPAQPKAQRSCCSRAVDDRLATT